MNPFKRLLEWVALFALALFRPTDPQREELLGIIDELLSPRYCNLLSEEEREFLEVVPGYDEIRPAHLIALKDIGLRVRGGPEWGDVVEPPNNEIDTEETYLDIEDEVLDGQNENN